MLHGEGVQTVNTALCKYNLNVVEGPQDCSLFISCNTGMKCKYTFMYMCTLYITCMYMHVCICVCICVCIYMDITIISLSFEEPVFQLRGLRVLNTNFNVFWGECKASPTYQQFSNTRWASYHVTQFWHYLPEVSIKFKRLRTVSQDCPSLQVPIVSPGYHVSFWLSSFRFWGHLPWVQLIRLCISQNSVKHFTYY